MEFITGLFRNNEGKPSLANLLKFCAFPFSTWMAIELGTETALGIYGSFFILDAGVTGGLNAYKSIQTQKIEAGK